jgi:hypothetical protein
MPQDKSTQSHPSRHHIWPGARDGSDEDVNRYPRERWGENYDAKHRAWHILFAHMTPPEVLWAIRAHMRANGDNEERFFTTFFLVKEGLVDLRWKEWVEFVRDKPDQKKQKKRRDCWRFLFGESMSALAAIEWIEREFIRKKWQRYES